LIARILRSGPWTGNCIGQSNHAHFVRFLFSTSSLSIYLLALFALRVVVSVKHDTFTSISHPAFASLLTPEEIEYLKNPTFLSLRFDIVYPFDSTQALILVLNVLILVVLLLTVGILAIYQGYYLLKGRTTIEDREISKVDDLASQGKMNPHLFPFDLGYYRNICALLGDNPFTWLLPKRAAGDGLHFQVRKEFQECKRVYWPPKEYYVHRGRSEYSDSDSEATETDSSDGYSSQDDEDKPLAYLSKRVRRGSEGYVIHHSQ
jgi:hypothetical protein